MKPRLLLCGNYGVENVGDEAILRVLMQQFSPEYEITVMSANPTRTAAKLGIEAVHFLPTGLRSWLRAHATASGRKAYQLTQNALKACDLFVLGGGTLLTDEPPRSLWIWGKHLEAAYKKGKKVWIWANGIGSLKSSWGREWGKKLVLRAEKVSVRDEKSLQTVREWGRGDAIKVKDSVFEWNPPATAPSASSMSTQDAIIFVPRYWAKNKNNIVDSFKKMIQYICLEKGKKVIGIPFEKDAAEDVDLLNTIFEQAEVGEKAVVWKNYADEVEVYNAIRTSAGVVGMRLHSLVFAAKAGLPFLGISYMDKVAALGEELEKANSIFPIEGLSGEKLIEKFEEVWGD